MAHMGPLFRFHVCLGRVGVPNLVTRPRCRTRRHEISAITSRDDAARECAVSDRYGV